MNQSDGNDAVASSYQPFRSKFPWYGGHLQFPWYGGHLQTVSGKLLGKKLKQVSDINHRRIVLPLRDGSGNELVALAFDSDHADERPWPHFLLLHGLGGTAQSSYMTASAAYFLQRGHSVILLNFRGAGVASRRTEEVHHPGRSDDIASALKGLMERLSSMPQYGVFVVGFSLGGNVLLKFLGSSGDKFPVVAGRCISEV